MPESVLCSALLIRDTSKPWKQSATGSSSSRARQTERLSVWTRFTTFNRMARWERTKTFPRDHESHTRKIIASLMEVKCCSRLGWADFVVSLPLGLLSSNRTKINSLENEKFFLLFLSFPLRSWLEGGFQFALQINLANWWGLRRLLRNDFVVSDEHKRAETSLTL